MAKKMTEVGTRDLPLKWDVFVTPGIPTVTSDLPPGAKQQMWSSTSSTLIYGKRTPSSSTLSSRSSRRTPW